MEHKYAKNRCKHNKIERFPVGIKGFADAFATMQDKRHDADYNPLAQFTRSSVTADLQMIESAMENFKKAPLPDRRAFCAFLLFPLKEDNTANATAKTKNKNTQ